LLKISKLIQQVAFFKQRLAFFKQVLQQQKQATKATLRSLLSTEAAAGSIGSQE
jgi:hypothetical protein